MVNEILRELIGQRLLLTIKATAHFYSTDMPVDEYKILDVSPSGNWVKLMNINGRKFWKAVSDIALVEVLHSLEPKPEEDK